LSTKTYFYPRCFRMYSCSSKTERTQHIFLWITEEFSVLSTSHTSISHKNIQGISACKMNTNDLAQTANRQLEVNNTSWVIQLKVNWHSPVELVANATFHRIPTLHKDSKSLTILGFQEKYDGNSVIQTLLYLIYLSEIFPLFSDFQNSRIHENIPNKITVIRFPGKLQEDCNGL
jgi:hypothetical protein